jgi:hypothetical protein
MTFQSIPASTFVNVTPGVISAGGSALSLTGLMLTANTRIPIGTVQSFANVAAVSAYFGASDPLVALAQTYFNGFDGSTVKPGALLITQYPTAATAAYLRGGAVTLAQVNAITSGTLTITSNGTVFTSSALNLSTATSLTNAATSIQAAFTSPTFTVTYDSIGGGFLVTSTTTGATSILSFATGTNAAPLGLTAATGAVVSAGAAIGVAATFMAGVIAQTQNFVSWTTTFEPSTPDCISFAQWNNAQGNRYRYCMWDTDATVATTVPATASAGYAITQANYSGTVLVYAPTLGATAAAFALSIPASVNPSATNGRATSAFLTQTGLTPDIVNTTVYANMIANGYNGYVSAATANQQFNFYSNGSISGPFLWDDSYVDQVSLNNGLQLALMTLLTTVHSIPYNATGYALISAACADPIAAAVNFGSIRPGVALSALQIAEINNAVGFDVSVPLQTRGWVLVIGNATSQVRAARTSPPISLYYVDGQSVQNISLFSEEVQ